jgi:quinol monooxygenase YgiN
VIYVVATLRAHPGKLAKALEAAKACIAETRKEDGCISYDLHQSIGDAQALVFVERWSSRDALDKHFKTPHLAAWRAVGAECIAERKVEIIVPEKVDVL